MFFTKNFPILLLTFGGFAQGFEEIDLIAYIKSTTVYLRSPEFAPGVFYMVYLTEKDGNTEPIALDNHITDQVTLIYDIDETVSRIQSYGLDPVEGVRYREIYNDEFEVGIDFDLLNTLPMGISKYFEKIRNLED